MEKRIATEEFLHTGPDTTAGRFLRKFWHPVCCSHELPRGRAVPVRLLHEDLTVYRGQSGTPYAIGFRCAHRGTQLSVGWVEEDCLRCFYHGWKYNGSGKCIEQPAEPKPFADRIRIPGYPVHEYLGLIFAYLGAGEPPPFPVIPGSKFPPSHSTRFGSSASATTSTTSITRWTMPTCALSITAQALGTRIGANASRPANKKLDLQPRHDPHLPVWVVLRNEHLHHEEHEGHEEGNF